MSLLRHLPRRLSDAVYWVRYRIDPRHRYHVVHTGLEPSYYDVDTIMLHACMALLCRYIEDERGGEAEAEKYASGCRAVDPNAPDGLNEACANMEDEALAIYRWWKRERPANHERNEKWLHVLFSGKWEKYVNDKGEHCFGLTTPPDLSMGSRKEFYEFERKLDEDDQRMLHRLIDIRGGLWT